MSSFAFPSSQTTPLLIRITLESKNSAWLGLCDDKIIVLPSLATLLRIDKTRVLSKEDKENKMQKEKMMQSYVTIKVVVQLVNALAPRHH